MDDITLSAIVLFGFGFIFGFKLCDILNKYKK